MLFKYNAHIIYIQLTNYGIITSLSSLIPFTDSIELVPTDIILYNDTQCIISFKRNRRKTLNVTP